MGDAQTYSWLSRRWPLVVASLAAAGLAIAASFRLIGARGPGSVSNHSEPGQIEAEVHRFCGHCHRYPPAESFPRSAWRTEVERGYQFYENSRLVLHPPALEQVVSYYEERAPLNLPVPTYTRAPAAFPVRFQVLEPAGPDVRPYIAGLRIAPLSDPTRPEIIACDMRNSRVMALRPFDASPTWRTLAQIANPARVQVVDLDGDGIRDLLVANLGSFPPTNSACGSVVWLRGARDGSFTPITLLEKVGRVADVRAADFRGTGKLDLVVAAFGWNELGETLFLENQTTDWSKPRFVPRVIDARHGAIDVPIADLDGDGRPDFVALIAQEHETIVAFLNRGDGNFEPHTLFEGEHPGLGSSGIELVDLDGDGDLDVLYTNGDVLDAPYLLKPYHGIQWLENRGGLHFDYHSLAPMYGVHRAIAADFDGDGDLDIVAVSFLPPEGFPQRAEQKLEAIILLEQVRPGEFVRHTLQSETCDHVVCVAADLWGSGRPDLVFGTYGVHGPPVKIWKNLGRGAAEPVKDPRR